MARPTTPKPQSPAKRGDLVAVTVEHSATYTTGRGTQRWTSYLLGVVESVTRAGWVKALRDARGTLHRATGDYYLNATRIPADTLAFPALEVLGRVEALLGGAEVRTLDELRALVAPWAVEGRVTPWGNGIGWDVDRHHVTRIGQGELAALRVALCGLPDGVESPVRDVPAPSAEPSLEFLRDLVRSQFPEAK